MTIILLALVGAVIAAVVGTLWYSDKTPMGKLHMKYLGFDKLSPEEQARLRREGKAMMPKMYAMQAVLSFLSAFAVVVITTMSMQNGVSFGLALGFVFFNWLCFIVPTIGTGLLWGNCDRSIIWKKFFSDTIEVLVVLLLTALVTSWFV